MKPSAWSDWIPENRLVILVLLWAGIGALVTALLLPAWVWKIAGGIITAVALSDFFRTRSMVTPHIRRWSPHNFPVLAITEVKLQLSNRSTGRCRLVVYDHHPAHFGVKFLPQEVWVEGGEGFELRYQLKPLYRGDAEFSGVELQLISPLGLWRQHRFIPLQQSVRVYPNFAEISHYILLATHNRLSQIGIKQTQRRGEGSDFFQLREYHRGDSQRQIHWQASARLRKLISKDYQQEKDQQLIFLLDCGRRMRHRDEQQVHLDQALNALLLLAYIGVRQGDAVGMMTLGGERLWLPPRKGQSTVNHLLASVYDIDASLQPADYINAVSDLNRLQQRRALIVLITNTRNEDQADLTDALSQLTRRHLVVLADIRETVLDNAKTAEISSAVEALRYHAVFEYFTKRKKYHQLLRHRGIPTLDVTAQQLPVALINLYLDIKGSAVL